MALINFNNVSIFQEEQLILENVCFAAEEGQFIYLTGRVGSGKSTLLKSMYGEIKVADGTARILDFELEKLKRKHLPDLRRQLGIIFQDFQLLSDRTVFQNLNFVLRATGWKKKEDITRRIDDVLEMVNMKDRAHRMPNELSGGEKQRIAIARAILNKPRIILADEPTGNLDQETSRNITQLLMNISKAGSTVVMITHNLSLVQEFPGRVLVCKDRHIEEITGDDTAIQEEEKVEQEDNK